MAEALLSLWVVYDRPRDFPDHVVVRQQFAMRSGAVAVAPFCTLYRSIDEARADLEPKGLCCLMRHPDDDPTIVETWI
jgi:hypothetical protein